MEIIPAIDIIDGKCVRLTRGDYNAKTIYNESPLEIAKIFADLGIRRLHLVDLEGAREKRLINLNTLEKIATETDLVIDYGGGIQTTEDLQNVFSAGASMATIGSIAVKNKTLFIEWLKAFGGEKLILGADVRDGNVAVAGWLETTEHNVVDFIKSYEKLGVINVLCTDISRDGMLQGSAVALYKELQQKFPTLKIIASGGVTTLIEIEELRKAGVGGVIVGKAIYEGKIDPQQLLPFIKN